jgi:hypothetical protein
LEQNLYDKMSNARLEPMFKDVSQIRVERGRYTVQLEIPGSSTLTSSDIDRILRISTWDTDPNKVADGFEGGRAVLLRREKPIKIGPADMAGLQISGIGHRKMVFSTGVSTIGGDFYPPSAENFMKSMSGTRMSTSYAASNSLATKRPVYVPLGTYTLPDLREKVRNTMYVSKIKLQKMILPHIEAYGRYMDEELRNEQGEFGFIVSPVPGPEKVRAADEIMERVFEKRDVMRANEALLLFHSAASPYINTLVKGLRELHDEARVAHLQTHLGNCYILNGIPYLVDWGTRIGLASNVEENIINRTIDLRKPLDSYLNLFSAAFLGPGEEIQMIAGMSILDEALVAYSGNPDAFFDFYQLWETSGLEEFYATALWMKQEGMERYEMNRKSDEGSRKIGRNEQCPCGSGKKYKRCCSGA